METDNQLETTTQETTTQETTTQETAKILVDHKYHRDGSKHNIYWAFIFTNWNSTIFELIQEGCEAVSYNLYDILFITYII